MNAIATIEARDDARYQSAVRERLGKRTVASFFVEAAHIYGVTVAAIVSSDRRFRPARARAWAHYHAAAEGRTSLVDIGRRTGGRDHSTAYCAANTHAARHHLPLVTGARFCLVQAYEGPEPSVEWPYDDETARELHREWLARRRS